jgi:uncharacterized protein (DUF2062 family)
MPAPDTSSPPASGLRSLWHRRVISLLVAQFKQGISAEKLALTIALGLTLGIFPIIGASTALCLAVGVWLKLNQPVIQLANWIAAPLQVPLVLGFVRMGEWITRAQPVTFSVPELFVKFRESPAKFMQEFGLTGLRGILAWAVIAPLLIPLIYFLLLPPLHKLARLAASSPRYNG